MKNHVSCPSSLYTLTCFSFEMKKTSTATKGGRRKHIEYERFHEESNNSHIISIQHKLLTSCAPTNQTRHTDALTYFFHFLQHAKNTLQLFMWCHHVGICGKWVIGRCVISLCDAATYSCAFCVTSCTLKLNLILTPSTPTTSSHDRIALPSKPTITRSSRSSHRASTGTSSTYVISTTPLHATTTAAAAAAAEASSRVTLIITTIIINCPQTWMEYKNYSSAHYLYFGDFGKWIHALRLGLD